MKRISKLFKSKIIILLAFAIFLQNCDGGSRKYGETTDAVNYTESAPEDEMIETSEEAEMANGRQKKEAPPEMNTENESYAEIIENEFLSTAQNPLSTFSIDVDGASYSNLRRYIQNGSLPDPNAIRLEEMVNYFSYDYPQPTADKPFSVYSEVGDCPWNKEHRLVHLGLQGKKMKTQDLPPSNLVFLIDVSGSMEDANKLPLLKRAFALLVENLREEDRVAIVVYAGAAGLVLPSTSGANKRDILKALDNLQAGGSTAGGEGIELAYKVAKENFKRKGNNRVIIATDGDFNVGESSDEAMIELIKKKRDEGIFVTALGFGMGNYKDSKMEGIADNGNGNYYYIDTDNEAKKVMVNEMSGTLFTIAKDVKIQVVFNPQTVKSYRLIGYENRLLNNEDFEDDTKDAGEIGSGHTVTALYEVELASSPSDELLQVKLRYKKPDGSTSTEITHDVKNSIKKWDKTSNNFRFSASVASFGMLLRDSKFQGTTSFDKVMTWAKKSKGTDKNDYRQEFIQLVKEAKNLKSALASK